jgi:hypothetical protein
MRRAAPTLIVLAALATPAAAQISSAPNTIPGTQANPFPVLGVQTNQASTNTYRHLPSREMGDAIRIELAAAALYDFDRGQVRADSADYMQQAANLIFEKAKGPVRIECRFDRGAQAAAQKLAAQCADAVSKWLTVQERLTKVKFTAVGTAVPPPALPNPNDLFAKRGASLTSITIDFAKK